MTADLPVSISYGDFAAAMQSLGIQTNHLQGISYRPGRLTVEYVRVDDQGRVLAAGDNAAMVTTDIKVDRSQRSQVGTAGGAPMTALLWCVAVLAVWAALSVPVAILTARSIDLADEQSEAERAAAIKRHPSSRGAA